MFQYPKTEPLKGNYFLRNRSTYLSSYYEFIEFTSPVNVNEVEAMVNFYKGDDPIGASGEIQVEFDGRIYSGTFRIPASTGNKGRLDFSQADYWARIDIPKLLHLDKERLQVRRR